RVEVVGRDLRAKSFEGGVLDLADAFLGDVQHLADLAERELRTASQSEAVGNYLPLARAQRFHPMSEGYAPFAVLGSIPRGTARGAERADLDLVDRDGRPGCQPNPLQQFGRGLLPAGCVREVHFVSFLVPAELAKVARREADRIGPGGHG